MNIDEMKSHWDQVYLTKASEAVSWYQPHASVSLSLIRETGINLGAAIIDVGGGASTLVDDLLELGYSTLSVLDLSEAALDTTASRLGARGDGVRWLEADITRTTFPDASVELWHDRAVFHFLNEAEDRAAYIRTLVQAVKPGGHLIIGTFAENGPEKCSGLPVQRYSAQGLYSQFSVAFELVKTTTEAHRTPSGSIQAFVYCWCRRRIA
ncbi:MAG: class I SAM-dependent methyltransferase [Nevskia sp.]|nr:class I SAM-dependent methyltransferase [Nevskia sp.]